MNNKCPQGWEETTLDNICEVLDKKRKPITKKNRTFGMYPYYGATGIVDYVNEYIFDCEMVLLGEDGAKWESGEKSAFIAKGKYWVNNHAHVLKINEHILNQKFLVYLLNFMDLSPYITGATVLKLNQSKMLSIKIIFPNLNEQQRIVKILDEAFRKIDKAKQNAEQNLKNSKEFFESYLNDYFANNNKTWKQYKLFQITSKIGSGSTPLGGKKAYVSSGISLIRSMNIYDRHFNNIGLAYINEKQAKKLDVVKIQENDVLLNITGASIARCCVVPKNILPARVNQHVSILRPVQDIVISDFLCFLLTSNFYKQKLLKDGEEGGSTRQALTKTGLEQFIISIPSTISEQQNIVEQLNNLQAKTKKLEQLYQQKIKDLDELKQSILQKAFCGEL